MFGLRTGPAADNPAEVSCVRFSGSSNRQVAFQTRRTSQEFENAVEESLHGEHMPNRAARVVAGAMMRIKRTRMRIEESQSTIVAVQNGVRYDGSKRWTVPCTEARGGVPADAVGT